MRGPEQIDAGQPEPLGATWDGVGTNVAVYAPAATAVELCVLGEHDSGPRPTEHRMRLHGPTDGVWHGWLRELRPGMRYGFRAHGAWDPWSGQRHNAAKLLLDPYAWAVDGQLRPDRAVLGHEGADDLTRSDADSSPFVPRSVVVDTGYDWQGDESPRTPWSETVVYELHVRGYTMRHPDVPPELRGTYAGLARPEVLEPLRDLGVTALELLPVQQHASELALLQRGLRNYWGYNPIAFGAPHADYSAAGSRGQQVREFRDLVRAAHQHGLEVILDVVYNHTAEAGEHGPTLSLRGLANETTYRLDYGRRYQDVTGCGNSLDLRHPPTLRLVMDTLRRWVVDFHVDGFRFDLATTLARTDSGFDPRSPFLSAVFQDPVLRQVKLIAEPWDLGPWGYQVGAFPPPWAEWNDRYRDGVRRFWLAGNRQHDTGGHPGVRDLAYRLSGSSDIYGERGRGPLTSVNFVTAHDGSTLNDLVTYERKHNEANGEDNRDGAEDNLAWNLGVEGVTDDPVISERRRRLRAAVLGTLLVSTGVPMLTAGDEQGRTQLGNNNAYCQDNEVSWVSWDLDADEQSLRAMVRQFLSLRREHPVLRQSSFFTGRHPGDESLADVAWFGADGQLLQHESWFAHGTRVLQWWLAGDASDDVEDETLLVVVQGELEDREVTLPPPPWGRHYHLLADTSSVASPSLRVSSTVTGGEATTRPGLSVAVYRAER
ncbi:MAG: glycogen debranching protein GlgX [Actinomycetales bacterium]